MNLKPCFCIYKVTNNSPISQIINRLNIQTNDKKITNNYSDIQIEKEKELDFSNSFSFKALQDGLEP